MFSSMTGYGRGESEDRGRRFLVEIKSVNHRYCDISVRMPRQVSFLEETAKKTIKKKISRGKVDVYVTFEDFGDETRRVLVDHPLARMYVEACKSLRDRYGLQDDISVSMLAGFPDIFKVEKMEDDEDELTGVFRKAMGQAVATFAEMRHNEGEKLKADIREKLRIIAEKTSGVEERATGVVVEYREKLEGRIKELLEQQTIDENRLATECAYFAERCCINEELVRMKSHIRQMDEALEMEEPVGRKLDFIVQEMHREANTIGSKSNDLLITNCVVDIKSCIDKIKEQVQNIE